MQCEDFLLHCTKKLDSSYIGVHYRSRMVISTNTLTSGNPILFWLDVAHAASSWLLPPDESTALRSGAPFPPEKLQVFSDAHVGEGEYRLFIPPDAAEEQLPLVVMLHGCSQDPDDFAAGTSMNQAAAGAGFAVLYPAQSKAANSQRCWNWFDATHQQRGSGEPALLAAMTHHAIANHPIDPERVYVAGLSAGGAMAAILGETYPDVYAAVGVHSGLAARAAGDLSTAVSAMQGRNTFSVSDPSGMPTIVFHGDADGTVHAKNGVHVIEACAGGDAAVESVTLLGLGGRDATRSLHRANDGSIVAEHWVVHGASHAWSGGSRSGSFADDLGPDASAEMLRFFSERPRRPLMEHEAR